MATAPAKPVPWPTQPGPDDVFARPRYGSVGSREFVPMYVFGRASRSEGAGVHGAHTRRVARNYSSSTDSSATADMSSTSDDQTDTVTGSPVLGKYSGAFLLDSFDDVVVDNDDDDDVDDVDGYRNGMRGSPPQQPTAALPLQRGPGSTSYARIFLK
jgi:hypothetical protein